MLNNDSEEINFLGGGWCIINLRGWCVMQEQTWVGNLISYVKATTWASSRLITHGM